MRASSTDNSGTGWLEEPKKARQVVDAARAEMLSDINLGEFYSALRLARPTDVSGSGAMTTTMGSTFADPFIAATKALGYNQTLEVTDACTASICQPLRPRVEPVAAKPDIARMCTLLNRVVDGVIEASGFTAEATSAWEDCYDIPNGYVFFETDPSNKEITCRRVNGNYVYFRRCHGRNPVEMYMDEPMSREVLIERYPDHEGAIRKVGSWYYKTVAGVDPPSKGSPDTVRVSRLWRRKVGKEPGRLLVVLENGTVLNGDAKDPMKVGEEWGYDFFPFAVARCRRDKEGFGGIPVVRYIAPHHLAITRLANIAEDSFKGAVPVVFAHKNSGVNSWTNTSFQVKKWDGSDKPHIEPTNPVSDQVLARIEYHDAKSYAQAGINKAIAGGQAPKGVVAAVAMREIVELADARKAEFQKHWESMWRQAGHIIVALAADIGKVRVSSTDVNGELMNEIDFKAIKLDKTDYRISYGVSSVLSKTVAGLMSDLGELKDLGFIDTLDMAEAIGNKVPDIQAVVDRVTAPKRLAAKMVQTAIEKGEIPLPPSSAQGQAGLDSIVVFCHQAWCQAMLNPDRHTPQQFEALRRLSKIAEAKKGAPLPQQQTIAPAAPMAPNSLVGVGTPVNPMALPPAPMPPVPAPM
jgi:hypothetical protein